MRSIRVFMARGILPLACLFFFGCTACDLFKEPGVSRPQTIGLEIDWTLPVSWGSSNEYGITTSVAVRREETTMGLVAFDLDTGEVIWRIQDQFEAETNPVIYNDSVVVQNRLEPYVHILDLATGQERRRIIISEDGNVPDESERNPFGAAYCWTLSGSRVYWGSFNNLQSPKGKTLGLLSLDLEDGLIPTAEPDVYIGVFDVLYENDLDIEERITSKVFVENGMVYFHSLPFNWYDYWEPCYRAVNVSTKEILWETEPQIIGSGSDYEFNVYKNDLLIYDGRGIGILNKSNGELRYESAYITGHYAGFFFVDNLIYFTNISSRVNIPPSPNVYCVNADTGEEVWSYLDGEESLGNRPVVYDGLLFVLAQTDMKIFDARTGEYLAVSEDAYGGFNQLNHNILYNEKYMIADGNDIVFCIDLEETAKRVRR